MVAAVTPPSMGSGYLSAGELHGNAPGAKQTLEKQERTAMPYEAVSEIDKKDEGTPDSWIARHPQLIRLTGRHPLNVEPPPEVLMERGFITPSSLHYVRNHGPVPRLSWQDHKLEVRGLVDSPKTFTMDEVAKMPQVTVLCTLTCAGNRRKEENMIKKTIGFSWGPAGTACSYWTGVRMSHLLKLCGVDEEREDLHVRFRGPKGELPKGKDGSYATSLPLWKCMWEGSDVIVAWKQNGRLLDPDHGFPVRMIIPGHIGGRMVKWLEEIEVADSESDNHYHFMDNRVLPSHVDEALAKQEGWWFKPDFIINELNVNSAITSPAHDEQLAYTETTLVKGYAYAGGQKIIRCEVSLDNAASWRLGNIQRVQERPNRGGKFWAWVHWELEVPTVDLLQTKELCCRAWTSDMNTQPNSFTWNLMGMMNNCVYRVKVHPSVANGMLTLRYEHPVLAGPLPGGWMNRIDEKTQPSAVEEKVPSSAKSNGRKISMAEVEKHASKESAWFVRDGKVYDGTAFLKDHPGGAESILLASGMDSTDDFNAIHSAKAKKMVEDYYIGDFDDSAPEPSTSSDQTGVKGVSDDSAHGGGHMNASADDLIALNPRRKQKFRLAEKQVLSHNVRRFRFELQSPKHKLGLPIGKHVYIYGKVDGDSVMRAYTPTSSDDELGYFDLVIKVYWKDQHPSFPKGGKLTQWLEAQEVGAMIEAKGPTGHFTYHGRGRYTKNDEEGFADHLSMIAGGTGLTPCYQVAQAVLKDPEDKTKISLVYCNQMPGDILLWDELNEMAAKHNNFQVWYCVSGFLEQAPERELETNWKYSIGRLTQEVAKAHLFPASTQTLALFCGPPAMITYACKPFCQAMGYTEEQMICF